jgi:hypothetical protein
MSRLEQIEDSAAWAWAGVALLCGCAALAALLTLFLVPLHVGTVIAPVAVLLALATNIALPQLARTLVESTAATLLPFVFWLIVVVYIGVVTRPEGDVVLPGGGGAEELVAYGVLLGGALAGTVTVVLSTNARATTRPQRPSR